MAELGFKTISNLAPEWHGEEEKESSAIKVAKTWGGTERPLLLTTHKGWGKGNS